MGHYGIQCEIETVGIPDIIPAEVVTVYGVGKRYSDKNYYVSKVIHSVGGGGFTTRLTLISNIGAELTGQAATGPRAQAFSATNTTGDDRLNVEARRQREAFGESDGDLSESSFNDFIRRGAT